MYYFACMTQAQEIARFLRRIRQTVEALYAGTIDMETFDARQRATWDDITAAGHTAAVLRSLRTRKEASS